MADQERINHLKPLEQHLLLALLIRAQGMQEKKEGRFFTQKEKLLTAAHLQVKKTQEKKLFTKSFLK